MLYPPLQTKHKTLSSLGTLTAWASCYESEAAIITAIVTYISWLTNKALLTHALRLLGSISHKLMLCTGCKLGEKHNISVRDCAWAFFSLQKERWHPYPHLPHHGDIRFVSKGTRSWQRNAPQSKSYFPEPSSISSRFSYMHISERWSIFSVLMEQAGMSSRVAMARQ